MILHSQVLGKGKPLIILHGFLGMSDNWKSLGKKFSENGFEVHLIDQRNHGRSFHSEEFTYEIMVDDLKAYCEHYSLDNIILLGHSMGGKVAMLFAVTYPERLLKLVVADIAPKNYPKHHQEILNVLSLLDFSKIKTRKEADDIVSPYIEENGVRQFLLKNLYWIHKGELGLRINLPVFLKKIEEIGKPLRESAQYSGDTLFLSGSRSGYILPSDKVLIKSHFPNSEIITIRDAGHWLHAEKPIEFFHHIMNFIK